MKSKIKSAVQTSLVAITLLSPALASAASNWSFSFSSGGFSGTFGSGATCSSYLACFGGQIIYIINAVLVPVLFAVAFIVFLFGVFKTYIWSVGDETEVTKGHKFILWGLIGFAVMISVWGLVNIISGTFGLDGVAAPPTPTSYPAY